MGLASAGPGPSCNSNIFNFDQGGADRGEGQYQSDDAGSKTSADVLVPGEGSCGKHAPSGKCASIKAPTATKGGTKEDRCLLYYYLQDGEPFQCVLAQSGNACAETVTVEAQPVECPDDSYSVKKLKQNREMNAKRAAAEVMDTADSTRIIQHVNCLHSPPPQHAPSQPQITAKPNDPSMLARPPTIHQYQSLLLHVPPPCPLTLRP